ncbi:MAG: hypothetical protein IIB31_09010, partial [Chloroflexi bacterium]|nr:hypothetical protein [Chloroflexota bacterium]
AHAGFWLDGFSDRKPDPGGHIELWQEGFSDNSFGFRPGRNAHDTLRCAVEHISAGHTWVVNIDLEKFFDRVNHDMLMVRIARKIEDKQVLKLIRRYLQAGIMEDGVVMPRTEETVQGAPLSPLLSNIMLDDLNNNGDCLDDI